MDKNSTHLPHHASADKPCEMPKSSTIDFIMQFARVYLSVPGMSGVVLN